VIVLARPPPASALYLDLMECAAPGAEPCDAHVLACALAVSAGEAAATGAPLPACVGLGHAELLLLLGRFFPTVLQRGTVPIAPQEVLRAEDEQCLVELLRSCASSPLSETLALVVARRAQRKRHLWQDLGLRSRGELSELMTRHFAPLKARNRGDMKWKKFFARALCLEGSFPICTAPSCGECDDFDGCFGDESGESALAHLRR
jgi:nitrogen fixation protein NifQ